MDKRSAWIRAQFHGVRGLWGRALPMDHAQHSYIGIDARGGVFGVSHQGRRRHLQTGA